MKTSTVNHLSLNHRPSDAHARTVHEQWLLVQLEGERDPEHRGLLRRLLPLGRS